MTTQELEKEILKEVNEMTQKDLLELINFIRQKKKNVSDVESDLKIMSESQTKHLESEFESYKKIYPSE